MSATEQTPSAGELAVKTQSNSVGTATTPRQSRWTPEQLANAEIGDSTQLPTIKKLDAAPVPLSVDFWSPMISGESKRGWVLGIEPMMVPQKDFNTGELIGMAEMDCVLFVEEAPDGMKKRIYTSARLLVSYISAAIQRGEIVPRSLLTPIQITYKGTRTTRSGRKASEWEILPLIVAG